MIKGKRTHFPVLLKEAIAGLAIEQDGIYIDGTFGRGGHVEQILEKLSAQGRIIAIDKDPEAISFAKTKYGKDQRFQIQHSSFGELYNIAQELNILGKVNGILLDLGVSSPQLDNEERGFSFLQDGPLDMRMNPNEGLSAATWLEQVEATKLAEVLKIYGEERYAKRIANAIIKARETSSIKRTKQLAEIISAANPKWEKHKHPATRSFQAIRIFINRELDDLQSCLIQSLDVLKKGGRLVVISFHSLEDRIVKQFMQKHAKGDYFPLDVAIKHADLKPRLKRIGKQIKPGTEEIAENPRARSAVLRIAEKTV